MTTTPTADRTADRTAALDVIDNALEYAQRNLIVSQSRAFNALLDVRLVVAEDPQAIARLDEALGHARAAVYGSWLAAALHDVRDLVSEVAVAA